MKFAVENQRAHGRALKQKSRGDRYPAASPAQAGQIDARSVGGLGRGAFLRSRFARRLGRARG
jgi:hypothetical protein